MEIRDIVKELSNLRERIDLIDSNIKFNISEFISVLALVAAISATALYLLAKNIVEKSVQNKLSSMKNDLREEIKLEISQLDNELFDLRSGLDKRIIELIDNRFKIGWAMGQVMVSLNQKSTIFVEGHIDWDSPITSVRIIDRVNKKEVPFELSDKQSTSFSFVITEDIPTQYLDWVIVWYDKTNN